jgi:hypothetical protein
MAKGVPWVGSNERKHAGDASRQSVHADLANRGHPAERIAGKFRLRVIHTHSKATSRTFVPRRHQLSALYILMNKCRRAFLLKCFRSAVGRGGEFGKGYWG